LLLELTEDGRTARWRFDAGAFGTDTITRMAAEWHALLASIAGNPDRTAGDLEIVPAADVTLVVTERNRTQQAYPRDACLHQVVEAQVDRAPDRVAITCGRRALTYAELDASANRVAHFLLGRGVRPDDRVGICIDRSPEMLTAMLGILKAGAAYVPLDPLYPPDRLAYMIQDGGCEVILTEQAFVERLPREGVQLVSIDARPSPTEHAPVTRPAVTVDPAGLAYVMYTSGSTGKPKGVEVPHRGVVNFLFACQREPGFRAADVMLAISTISFDISVTELFLPLITGARVEIVPRAVADDGVALGRALAESGATVLQATPATFRLLLEARWTGAPGLRVFSIGEALPRELANNLLDRVSELWNAYGPTETTVWSTVGRVAREGPVHIGHALANTTLYVVDTRLRLMPVGCTGELLIGGDGVVRGYHGRPDLTAERFLTVRYAGYEERVYRTGDLVRYLPDGELECLGRIDNQVKIRGFRIELGEIESVLDRHPAIQGSAVIAREDTPGDRRLAAYVVPTGSASQRDVLVAELRARAQEALPPYMMPSAFVILDEFPLTQNGKIDRKALPRPGPESAGPPADHEAPRGALERMLADAWQHALGVANVGRSGDFFELGGHSLLVQRLRTAIAERTGHAVSTIDVYRHPTVASLAAKLAAGATDAAGAIEQAGETYGHGSVGPLRRLVQRFLVPRFVTSLYFLVRFGAKVSPHAEAELSPLLEFGKGCVVGSFTKIKASDGPVRFGSRCGIANSCFITGGKRGIHIGDNFTCGPGVSIVSSSYIHDRLDAHIWDQGLISAGIRIGSNVWLGASVTVLDGAELGDNTIVVAGSVVEGKHPPGVILRGNPASIVAYR
jgi:amino acid adenylation domain-containing protein